LVSGKIQVTGELSAQNDVQDQIQEPDWDPMCVFPAVFLSYDIPRLKKREAKNVVKQISRKRSASKNFRTDEREKKSTVEPEPAARGLVGKNKRYA
jgi:hypothetical protein